jgi:flagellar hook assembly protein FlgD
VSLTVFDASGRRTRQLEPPQSKVATRYDVSWDGRDDAGRPVRPGLYIVRLEVGDRAFEQRVPFLR